MDGQNRFWSTYGAENVHFGAATEQKYNHSGALIYHFGATYENEHRKLLLKQTYVTKYWCGLKLFMPQNKIISVVFIAAQLKTFLRARFGYMEIWPVKI